MQAKAKLKNLRISPRKVRLLANLIKGMHVNDAKVQLRFSNKKSSEPLLKLLNSAIANAKNNSKLQDDSLYISKLLVNAGQTMKRWKPRAMGRASEILKRTSSVIIELDERKNNIEKNQKDLTEKVTVEPKKSNNGESNKKDAKTLKSNKTEI